MTDVSGRETTVTVQDSCNWADKNVFILLQQPVGYPTGPAAFLGLNLFKTDKTAGSDRVSGDRSSLWNGMRDSSLWKDSIGYRNTELISLTISCSDRRAELSICKFANKGSEPGARAMSAIHLTALHHWLGLVCFRWFTFEAQQLQGELCSVVNCNISRKL